MINTGGYSEHPYLGLEGVDINYLNAQNLGVNVTYGWIITQIMPNSPSVSKLQVNDVIIGINGAVIKNGDELASYLEENTLSGEIVNLQIERVSQLINIAIVLGSI